MLTSSIHLQSNMYLHCSSCNIPHTFVTAVLSMMSRWSVGSLVPIYLHSLLAGWLVLCCLVSGSFTYTYLHTRLCLLHLRLLAEQYVFASAQAAYLCFRSVGSSKQAITLGPRPVSTSHRQSVRSSLGIRAYTDADIAKLILILMLIC